MNHLRERVMTYLDEHTTLNLATAGPGGAWAAAVLYVHDGTDLFFTSVATTRHARNVELDHHAAGTINDDLRAGGPMRGIQVEGVIEPLDDVETRKRIVAEYLRRYPFATALWDGDDDAQRIGTDPGIHGFYRFTPTRLWFFDTGVRDELILD